MDINQIQLPPALLQELYRNLLVDSPVQAPEPLETSAKGIRYLGQNRQLVTILVDYPAETLLPDPILQFLTNILQACKLDLGDVAIVNIGRTPASFADLTRQLDSRYLLAFGVDGEKIGLEEAPLFEATPVSKTHLVYAPQAELLNTNGADARVLKGKLWGCLKQLFNV